ncbi:hypothetical protein Tco_0930464 [Tanacetum coccineum]
MAEALQVTILNACDRGIFKDKSRLFGVGFPCKRGDFGGLLAWMVHGSLPFNYLGLLVGGQMRLSGSWQGIIGQFQNHLSSWKAKSLLSSKGMVVVLANLVAHTITVAFGWASSKMEINYKVKDIGKKVNQTWVGEWSWHIPPRRRAQDDLVALSSLLNAIVFSCNGYDKWFWSYDASECFKASLNRLATRPNLIARRVALPSSNCSLCELEVEDVENILVKSHNVVILVIQVLHVYFADFTKNNTLTGNTRSDVASLEQIRRILLDGYSVLDVRIVFFIFLRLSSIMHAF